MNTSISGGCACGAVRFRCDVDPAAMYNCHCRGCQLTSAAPYSALLVLPGQLIEITGPRRQRVSGIDGDRHALRSCCAECGMPLFAQNATTPHLILVNAVALDDAGRFRPIADIWTACALPWVHLDQHIPKVFKSPPLLEGDVA